MERAFRSRAASLDDDAQIEESIEYHDDDDVKSLTSSRLHTRRCSCRLGESRCRGHHIGRYRSRLRDRSWPRPSLSRTGRYGCYH